MSAGLKGWISLSDAAKAAGVPVRSMRRRMCNLAQSNPGLLKSASPPGGRPKWWVCTAVLERIAGDEHAVKSSDAELSDRLDMLETKLLALRSAVRKLRAENAELRQPQAAEQPQSERVQPLRALAG